MRSLSDLGLRHGTVRFVNKPKKSTAQPCLAAHVVLIVSQQETIQTRISQLTSRGIGSSWVIVDLLRYDNFVNKRGGLVDLETETAYPTDFWVCRERELNNTYSTYGTFNLEFGSEGLSKA